MSQTCTSCGASAVGFTINDGLLATGAFYLRLTGQPSDIYGYLEPLFIDFRRVRVRQRDGTFALSHVDEVSDAKAMGLLPLLLYWHLGLHPSNVAVWVHCHC